MSVRGQCDAKTEDHILEIKRRARRLFHSIPTYERIQLETYLRIYGKQEGALAESYEEELDVHWVTQDDALWEDVKVSIEKNLGEAMAERSVSDTEDLEAFGMTPEE